MTTTDQLPDVIPGVARYSGDTVTFGTYAEGGDVSALLTDEHGARKIWVTGNTGTGKTILLRSLLAGAVDAGIEANLIDPYQGDARTVVEHLWTLASKGVVDPPRIVSIDPLRLLLVDDLTGFDEETLHLIEEVARWHRKGNIALVVASQDNRLGSRAGTVARHMSVASVIKFAGSSPLVPLDSAPGVGEVNGDLFRVWWPGL